MNCRRREGRRPKSREPHPRTFGDLLLPARLCVTPAALVPHSAIRRLRVLDELIQRNHWLGGQRRRAQVVVNSWNGTYKPRPHARHSDLTKLACDDILIPTDADLWVTSAWDALGAPPPVTNRWADDGERVTASVIPAARLLGRRRRWVNTGATAATAAVGWLREGIRQAMDAVAEDTSRLPLHKRQRPLIGIPMFGVGEGGFDAVRGDALRALLDECDAATAKHGFDIVITCYRRSDYAALQRVRNERQNSHASLSDVLQTEADRLGGLAAVGGLALFIGAGVSIAAGLPSWDKLIEQIAAESETYSARVKELQDIPAVDAAALLKRENPQRFDQALVNALRTKHFAVSHALLASLRAQQAITTNFDTLYEDASPIPAGAPMTVLPWHRAVSGRPWLLKMHGDITSKGIVLSRDEFLGYDTLWRPLASVLQAALVTKHVLFVGYSLTDENFIRLGRDVSAMFERIGVKRLVGSVVTLGSQQVLSELWQGDLTSIAMSDEPVQYTPAAARQLEIFLDRVAMIAAADERSYLLDPRYRTILTPTDQELAAELTKIADRLRQSGQQTWQPFLNSMQRFGYRP